MRDIQSLSAQSQMHSAWTAKMLTMCIIVVTSLPGYLPSVRRGLMLKRCAPLSWATACASMVLPLPEAPYSSTAFGTGTLQWYISPIDLLSHIECVPCCRRGL